MGTLRTLRPRRRAFSIAAVSGSFCGHVSEGDDEVALFNGSDFAHWTHFLEQQGYYAEGRARIANFAILSPESPIRFSPSMHSALTARDYPNYERDAEYRCTDPQPQRGSGLSSASGCLSSGTSNMVSRNVSTWFKINLLR